MHILSMSTSTWFYLLEHPKNILQNTILALKSLSVFQLQLHFKQNLFQLQSLWGQLAYTDVCDIDYVYWFGNHAYLLLISQLDSLAPDKCLAIPSYIPLFGEKD